MEDYISLIWLGIAILWFLTRLVGRGVKKAAGGKPSKQARRRPPPPAARPATEQSDAARSRFGGQTGRDGRQGTGPPPIVPR